MIPDPRLVVEVLDDGSQHGPGTIAGIVGDAAKIGWSWYSRFPGNAFWTVRQGSPSNDIITPGLSHARIWYVDEVLGLTKLVFSGRIGEPDQSGDDVVWTAWSYLAELAISVTGYEVYYKSKKIGTEIVSPEWSRDEASGKFRGYGAKVRRALPGKAISSLLQHVATGTIQNPENSTGTVMLTDTKFGVIDVPRLLLFFDLSEIGRANTTNNVTFEITRETPHTFNFWKDKGSAYNDRILTHPGAVRDFRFVPGVLDIRNWLATIGQKSGEAREIRKHQESGTYGWDAFGLRQDTFTIKTLSGTGKDLTTESGQWSAQNAVAERAIKEATQLTRALRLDVDSREFPPFDGWDIEDTVKVQILRGMTDIDARYRVIGIRGRLDDNGYSQALFVALPVS